MRHSLNVLSLLLAIAAVLAVGAVRAAEPETSNLKPARSAAAPAATGSTEIAIPTCLKQLDLTAEQQDQIKAIILDYETDVASVWKQFSSRYVAAIRTEAMLLSAIEDSLTDQQRTQVREQRRRAAQHEQKRAATNVLPTTSTANPVSAVEQELAIVGVELTAEQEATADKVQEKYLSKLRSLNRDILGLHTRLVSLEADKFVEIEKVLTADQLKQLVEARQSAPETEVEAIIIE